MARERHSFRGHHAGEQVVDLADRRNQPRPARQVQSPARAGGDRAGATRNAQGGIAPPGSCARVADRSGAPAATGREALGDVGVGSEDRDAIPASPDGGEGTEKTDCDGKGSGEMTRIQAEDLKQSHRRHGKRREERERIGRRALELQKQGVAITDVAQRLGVSPSYIHAAMRSLREGTGGTNAD